MNITTELDNGKLTVYIEGKLDTSTAPQATERIEPEAEKADSLVLDMKDLKYISSAGLRLILSLHKKMAAKGGMIVKNVNETNMEIFDLTGFTDILNFE